MQFQQIFILYYLEDFFKGAGAIGAVVTATISDLKRRTKSKSYGNNGNVYRSCFAASMIAGPTLGSNLGVEALFYITMIIALGSIFVLIKLVPNPPQITHTHNNKS